jgi:hypothetical protein
MPRLEKENLKSTIQANQIKPKEVEERKKIIRAEIKWEKREEEEKRQRGEGRGRRETREKRTLGLCDSVTGSVKFIWDPGQTNPPRCHLGEHHPSRTERPRDMSQNNAGCGHLSNSVPPPSSYIDS